MTQQQIAELAGVSHVAVSYALHRPHLSRISADKQKEIQEIARRMGYQPRRLTTRAIGLFVGLESLHLHGVSQMVFLANDVLAEHQYSLLLVASDRERQEPMALAEKSLDGLLVFGDLAAAARALPASIPRVMLADVDPDSVPPDVDLVTLDTTLAAQTSTEHLLRLGHRRFCLVQGSSDVAFHHHLAAGMRRALAGAGLPPEAGHILAVSHNYQIAAQLQALMASPAPPTGILTSSSGKASVVLSILLEMGLRVPRDVSLVSLDDSQELGAFRPAITAHTQTERAVVETAVQRLTERIKRPGRVSGALRLILPGSFHERSSTGPAPQ